jgi:hypothetical protein
LAQPILNALNGTAEEWLKNFLFAFNSGNIDKFNQFLNQYKTQIEHLVSFIKSLFTISLARFKSQLWIVERKDLYARFDRVSFCSSN